MAFEKGPWIVESEKTVYENPWIKVQEDQVIQPDGKPSIYGTVHYKNRAAGAVPVDSEGNTWLVGQYRYPHDSYSWEIPEGGVPSHEDRLEGMKRELQEETGIIAQNWTLLAEGLQLSNSTTDEEAWLWLAEDLEFAEASPDGDEVLEVIKIPLSEALEWVYQGKIKDGMSVIGIMLAWKAIGESK